MIAGRNNIITRTIITITLNTEIITIFIIFITEVFTSIPEVICRILQVILALIVMDPPHLPPPLLWALRPSHLGHWFGPMLASPR